MSHNSIVPYCCASSCNFSNNHSFTNTFEMILIHKIAIFDLLTLQKPTIYPNNGNFIALDIGDAAFGLRVAD